MRLTLMHPPLDDPTIPYHANAHLLGHLVANGFSDVAIRDINIEFINYCLEAQTIESFYAKGEERLRKLKSKAALRSLEQAEFLELWKGKRLESGELNAAVAGLRNREAFLDYPAYLQNIKTIQKYFHFIGALSFPSSIENFAPQSTLFYSIYNLNDLFDSSLANQVCQPFIPFCEERLKQDAQLASSDCFGISIVYDHQMVHALWLARTLKQLWPEKQILLGGTAVSQFYKYMKDKRQMSRFFDVCDAIVVGEGETAVCELLSRWPDVGGASSAVNTITYDRRKETVVLPTKIHYENVPSLGAPIYDYSWELYLSPERGINYAPTRGCYWNRCTFCDYGLNTDKPTSPWRERKIDQVVSDLRGVIEKSNVEYVYFAVDVMAPGYLERLSDAIIASRLKFTWASELRMEKIFSRDRCKKLSDAGCVCISFGMESGNQRILDLIDKGTKISDMEQTMKNFSSSGIAVQLMAFSGFPSETASEKEATINFVKKTNEFWATGGIGTFVLTGTAMVAKTPELYGIKVLERKDLDVARALTYNEGDGDRPKIVTAEQSDASFNDAADIFPQILGRPWAGGTDTLHSMIYYKARGKHFFKENSELLTRAAASSDNVPAGNQRIVLNGRLCETSIDINALVETRGRRREYVMSLFRDGIEPTYRRLLDWQNGVSALPTSGGANSYWITNEEKSLKLHYFIFKLLSNKHLGDISIDTLLGSYSPEIRELAMGHIKALHSKQMISFAGL